ncbi:AbiH family protein, partial [Gilliamella apicola]
MLIGNGFDLAHRLETSFNNFINYCVFEMLNVISKKYKNRNIDNHFLVSNDIVD